MSPSKRKFAIIHQICNLIPRNLVSKLARKYGVDKQARSFSPWSHVVSLIYAQLAHSLSLNDVCDALRNHKRALSGIRKATPPSKSVLSYANRTRNSAMAKELFQEVLKALQKLQPRFGYGHGFCNVPHRFRTTINAVDSTTIKLFANCIDWAKHTKRKAAAKMHLRLDLQSFLPRFVLIKPGNSSDPVEARELCAQVKAGEIVVWDKAYNDFGHLNHLNQRGVYWVCRAKDAMAYKTIGQHAELNAGKNILKDDKIELTIKKTREQYPDQMRLVQANVLVNGEEKKMTFITNNMNWAASSVADLYKSRWGIELFFKQIKQTLQVADFLGHNEHAVQWQVWTALLTYVLLRFIGYTNKWESTFPRLFTVLRAVLWSRLDLISVLESCGTATKPKFIRPSLDQPLLPGFI